MKPKRGISKTKDEAPETEYASTITQLQKLLNSQLLPLPKGPPKTEEEKQAFFVNLVRLKEQRLTNSECGERLGVSERTICNYTSEPLYEETRSLMISDAKENGHMLLSEIIPHAVAKLFDLLNDKSGFVQFKAAETILAFSGYSFPREDAKSDSRDGVAQFLREVEERRRQQTVVNVQINQVDGRTVDSVAQEITSFSYEPVQAGGRLPASFARNPTPIEQRLSESKSLES